MTQPLHRKIITPAALAQTVRQLQAAGKTVVQCHGCFDIVHPGHVRYLQFARQLGDVLLVSLTGDALITKGPDRPYVPQELRAENLAALEFVDWVVIDVNPTACELLELLRPNVYVKGREYAVSHDPRFLRERQIVERGGGRVIFHSGDVVFSSTRLIQTLEQDSHLEELRLRTLCRRNAIDALGARAAVDDMADVPVIVAGDLLRIRTVVCDALGAADDAPVMSLRKLGAVECWGGAAAVALQLRALGARPTLLAAVPSAILSQVREELSGLGITPRLIPMRGGLPEDTTFVADEAKVFHLTEGASTPLDSEAERDAFLQVQAATADARALVWCDRGYGFVTPQLVDQATQAARGAGMAVTGSAAGPQSDLDALRDLDLVTTTERRLREARHDMSSGLPAVVWRFLTATGGRAALVSLHKRGVIGFWPGQTEDAPAASQPGRLQTVYAPALARRFIDLSGTDEAVLAVATLLRICGRGVPLSAYLASAAESLVGGRAGGSPVTDVELRAWIDSRPELRPDSRFLPDAATIADIARIAPPLMADRAAADEEAARALAREST